MADEPAYLKPYIRAIEEHGDRFDSLLWASRKTQAARFDALIRLFDFTGVRMLDAGCGQADLLEHLIAGGIWPADYIGLEAMPEHVTAAKNKGLPRCAIIEADFVREPQRLLAGADVVLFCGSLNTMDGDTFRQMVRIGFEAAAQAVMFNFLCSTTLAAATWLTWHDPGAIADYARTLSDDVAIADDYLDGDCTLCIRKPRRQRRRMGRTCL